MHSGGQFALPEWRHSEHSLPIESQEEAVKFSMRRTAESEAGIPCATAGTTTARRRASITCSPDTTTPPFAASSTPTATPAPVRASSGTTCLRTAGISQSCVKTLLGIE